MSRRMSSREWDLVVVHAILTGWCFSKINTFNSSLLFAWMVCLCDLVYCADTLARTSKHARLSKGFVNASFPDRSNREFFTYVSMAVSCVPYHVLVFAGLDISGVYLLLCALRLARLQWSGRINVRFQSIFSTARKRMRQAFSKTGKTTKEQQESKGNGKPYIKTENYRESYKLTTLQSYKIYSLWS